ncbi:MAG: HD domain-containing protein [Bacteroidetes bacterium]|nr:HD domain-containing protein [Bacteroidota bacterium]
MEILPDILGAKHKLINLLSNQLDVHFSYHSLEHSLDVFDASLRLCKMEKINNPRLELLIATAALYHDTGFTIGGYKDHEEAGCAVARKHLPELGYTNEDLDEISKLILATKLPQNPQTIQERIICDADLDYLGREDYYPISSQLKDEFSHFGIIKTESDWLRVQITFFKSHTFFTNSAKEMRNERKMQYLEELINQRNSMLQNEENND